MSKTGSSELNSLACESSSQSESYSKIHKDEKQQTREAKHTPLYVQVYLQPHCLSTEGKSRSLRLWATPGSIALHEVGFYAVPGRLPYHVLRSRLFGQCLRVEVSSGPNVPLAQSLELLRTMFQKRGRICRCPRRIKSLCKSNKSVGSGLEVGTASGTRQG